MAQATVRVKGLREVQKAFNRLDKGLAKEMRDVGKAAAEPVAAEFRARISRYRGASVNTVKTRSNLRGAFVVQNARKVTGRRSDFGALQMRHLIGSLEDKRGEVIRTYEEGLDNLTRRAGF